MKRDLSAEARSAKVDHLDEAIDQVAARLTRVDDNDALAANIINALPERVSWFGWLFHSWAPRLAMIAIVVAAGMVWGNRREVSTPIAPPLASVQPVAAPTALVAAVREAVPNRTMRLERLERLERVAPFAPSGQRVDFDRSLPAIAAVSPLEFGSLAPVSLSEDAPLTLAPLTIADLPLTAETISPR
jgi:hypothetical protein